MNESLVSIAEFLAATLRIATPLIFASLAVLIVERAGIFGLGVEGVMLAGAFCSVIGASRMDNPIGGIVTGMIGGLLVGLLYAYFCTRQPNNQILVALALNLTMLGVTSFLQRVVFGADDTTFRVAGLEPIALPGLSQIPVVGPALFNQPALTYVALIVAPILSFVLYRTHWGLALRSTGENPVAVDTVGISVARMRLQACVVFGILGGLGGAVLVLQQVHTFTENISAGRGFIALVSVIFGRWDPVLSLGAATLFGAAEAAQTRVQLWNLPISSYFILMFPYLLALLALLGFGGRARYPAAIGKFYDREKR